MKQCAHFDTKAHKSIRRCKQSITPLIQILPTSQVLGIYKPGLIMLKKKKSSKGNLYLLVIFYLIWNKHMIFIYNLQPQN